MNSFLSWVEIDKKALLSNISSLRKLIGPKVALLAVVKGNAYGHGIEVVAKMIKDKVDWFGVNSLDEALTLKKLKIKKPILILGYTSIIRLKEVVLNGFRQVVYDKQTANSIIRFIELSSKVKVHLKIESGTNRQGVENKELLEVAKILKDKIEGIYTHRIEIEGASMHFATLEEEENKKAFYKKQLGRFKNQLDLLKKNGISPKVIHTAATAAVILYPETYFDMVRVGIGLYGLWPSDLTKKLAKKKGITLDLKPVLSWKTRVAQIKKVKKGETIGYGRTYTAGCDMKIAILPIGYFDGYDRHLSNQGRVLIKGKLARIVGRVMMNMVVVDVTEIPNIKVENEVILIGKDGKNEITAEELAQKIGTINYEVVTRINQQLPRILT